MGTCHVCWPEDGGRIDDTKLVDHLRRFHPEVFGDGPERWPDGQVVIYDKTLESSEFETSTEG